MEMKAEDVVRIDLSEKDIPRQWYNIHADMPSKLDPFYNPMTKELLQPQDLMSIFPMGLLQQEMSMDRFVDVPDEVWNMYRKFRPSPIYRARALEKALGTPARIYYKYEGGNATGSHKLNTALAQVYYNKIAGIKRIATETGAGQWGSAVSMACSMFGLDCTVYMVKCSYDQKPFRRSFMQLYGSNVISSPSMMTESGRKILKENPNCSGSLGIAISEAVEDAMNREDTNYALGSVLNHVCMHQTVIGLEAKAQMAMVDEYPDVIYACCGGGSNFSGLAFPFLMDKFAGKQVKAVAVEPTACPTLTKGTYAYDYGDTAGVSPIVKMYTLGSGFVPAPDHAGGLRYHGESPLVSKLYHDGLIEAVAYGQKDVFEAAVLFANTEGIVPAPESSHAIRAAMDDALAAKEEGKERVILFGLSGHGYFDMYAYDEYSKGTLENTYMSQADIDKGLTTLPNIK